MSKMAYGYSMKKRPSRKDRRIARQKEDRRRFASLAIAAGFFANPFGIGEAATEIVRKDNTPIGSTNNVYNIEPEKVVSADFAYNRFEKFALASGDIANLKFSNGSLEAALLANLVNNKIDINGVVNAIKGGKIDGHLMFLSPEGIAVGPTGVINAGQFTGIVPTRTAFDTLYNADNITLDGVNNLKDGAYANDKSIDISGHINTHSGIMLGAGVININDGAILASTKNVQFTDVVNTGSNPELAFATTGDGGDIILTAKQTSDVKDTKTIKENNQDKEVPNAIRWSDRSTDLSAAINIGTDAQTKGVQITSSDGAVKLTAESTSTYEDSTPMTLTNTLKGVIFGDEKTILDGVLDKLAKKEADANQYLYVNYSGKKNKAAINIGKNSEIKGASIDIAANSTVEIKQSLAASPEAGKKDSQGDTVQSGSVAVAAVAISRVYNNADVVIDGNLTAAEAGSITIAANADTKAALSASANGGDINKAAAGVAILAGDTKAKVTVNEGTTALTADKGKVSVAAVSKSDIDVKANAVGEASYVVSNVGVANYDTSADVVMNRSVTAGAVDIKAENTVTGLKMTVDNTKPESGSDQGKDTPETSDAEKQQDDTDATTEKNKGDEGKSEDEKESEKKSINPTDTIKEAASDVDTKNDEKTKDATGSDGKGGVQDVKDKVEGTNDGGDNAAKTSAFGLGASVGVVSNTNDANVTIGKSAAITASKAEGAGENVPDGSVNVNARTLIAASADKSQLSVKNSLDNANVEIGAAVLVSNVKNNATILLDNEGDNSAQIKGNGKVTLNAEAGTGKYKDGNDEKDSTLTYKASAESKSEEEAAAKFALDGSVGINTLKNNAIVLLGQQSKVEGTEVKLSSDATAKAEGTYGAEDGNSKVGVGATAGIQNIRNNSLVMAGKDAELKGSGSLEVSANDSLDAKNQVKNAGKGDSVGISGMVALSYGDSNSIVSIDDEAKINAPSVSVESQNSTNVDNSARSNAESTPGSKSFGIGVGIVNYDVNSVAMIGDNGSGITAPAGSSTDAEKAAQKIYQDAALARSVAGNNAGKLGAKTTGDAKGSITTDDLELSATTTGMLKNDAKANAAAKDESSGDEKSEKWTEWSKQGKSGADEAKKNTEDLEQDKVTSQNKNDNESAAPSASGAMGEAAKAADPDGTTNADDEGAAPPAGSSGSAGASIGIEGSVALTFLGGKTDAVLDNVTVKNVKTENGETKPDGVSSVDLSATDFLGSITLGGTSTKNTLTDGAATQVGIGGTFAMNKSTRNVDSLLRNSTIQDVSYLANEASKIGIEVAAGMGTSGNSGSGTSVSGSGVVYYNKAVQDVHALMINNNVTSTNLFTLLSNEATSTDFQIAGGLAFNSASGDNANVGAGGAVAISNLENNLSSGIIGGTYNDFTTVKVEAEKGTTQINGALAATKAGGNSGYGFEGAFAYGSVKNNVHAYIDNAETKDNLALGEVRVRAGEVSIDLDAEIKADKDLIANVNKLSEKKKQELQKAKDKEKTEADKNKQTLTDAGVDPTGKIYLDTSDTESSLDGDAKSTDEGKIADEAAGDEKSAKSLLDRNYSRTITAAMAGGWAGAAGAAAGIAYNYVKNDISADITNSTLATYAVKGEAASDSLIVSVGAGAAIGGKTFNGAGSGSWNDLKNDTRVNIANNTITGATILNDAGVTGLAGGKITAQAENTSNIFNITGEVAGGKGMAIGLSLAYNSLNNTTGSYLTGNTISMPNIVGEDKDSSVKVTTLNKSNALAVAGGVDVNITQSNVGAVGTVAINRGVNHTESVIDGQGWPNASAGAGSAASAPADGKTNGGNTTLDNLNSLVVAAEDVTKKTTVAGGISVGGKKVGVGGAVAYT
ncbi:MAG: leukotoxin LktA family filamentous adhesin, partial [Schwartzia sp.]|nr:leukotoxin LktA family filamentous adhesin [Schwartzia sp. (in: firmicutes)]